VLQISYDQRQAMIATCVRALPDEGCGLLVGTAGGVVIRVVPSDNVAKSAKVYEIDPKALLRSYREAEDDGYDVIGVFHSHTHSPGYPSPTDIVQAPDPNWHYVLVSFNENPTTVQSYRIVDGVVTEESVTVSPQGTIG
jgi:proteasome lid subunit RPN8/RPN11